MAVDLTQVDTPESAPVIDLGPDSSIYPASLLPDPADETASDAAQSETPVVVATEEIASPVDQAAPDSEAETSEPSRRERTRLLKAEEEEQVRSDERAKYTAQVEQAAQLEAQQKDAEARWAAIQEQAKQWAPSPETYQEIDSAAKRRDWDVLAKHGIYSVDDALDKLAEMDTQTATSTAQMAYWQNVFMSNAGGHFKAAAEMPGVDSGVVLGSDMGAALKHIYEAGASTKDTEWRGKYDALKAEFDALRGRAGADYSSPETGGVPSGGSLTLERYGNMSVEDANKLKPEQIDAMMAAALRAA